MGSGTSWPPDYDQEFLRRSKIFLQARQNPDLARAYYSENPIAFINDWCFTYDPRKSGEDLPSSIPFRLFERQEQLVVFLSQLIDSKSSGLIEKCRDMGATWTCVAFSVWLWSFRPGASVGFGSRKEMLVDRVGDMDSIFEKIRYTVGKLPGFLLPVGFDPKKHSSYMKLINPENDASITGEAGDNIGRGGRKLIYFKDESAHYERPELIEAALADNTNCQVDISSVNGTGNVFHRRRMNGEVWDGQIRSPSKTQVLIMDWRDHPEKTQEWYDTRKQKAEADGLLHVFNQEVGRSYEASNPRVLIKHDWIIAAIDAHIKLGIEPSGAKFASMDVADTGPDKHAIAIRRDFLLEHLEDWADEDPGAAAAYAMEKVVSQGCHHLEYDSIGVGSNVKSEFNRNPVEGLRIYPWTASASPLRKDSPVNKGDSKSITNGDLYPNLKSQGYDSLAIRFLKTYRAVNGLGEYDQQELISIPSNLPKLHALSQELTQVLRKPPASNGKLYIDKAPGVSKSPNLADAVMMAFLPASEVSWWGKGAF